MASETGGLARQVQHGLCQHGLAHAALAHKDNVSDLLITHDVPPWSNGEQGRSPLFRSESLATHLTHKSGIETLYIGRREASRARRHRRRHKRNEEAIS